MGTYIMLTRVPHEGLQSPLSLESLEQDLMEHVRAECPEVKWLNSYALLGPFDYLDIFEAPSTEAATKVSTLVRTYGHAYSEIWPATEWASFKGMLHAMGAGMHAGAGH